jgi:tetratricopeptide (TPR) repeat protein
VVSFFLGFLVWLPFLTATAKGGDTNPVRTMSGPAILNPLPNPGQTATEHERAGRKREAAAIYEELARTNAAARKVLSHRLVTIYLETGETNKALTWAREVMRNNPDPQAYLGEVHARLGQFKLAREILEQEITQNTNATRAVTLRWQLAEVCEKEGDRVKAVKLFKEAADAAKGTAMEAVARQRVNALK